MKVLCIETKVRGRAAVHFGQVYTVVAHIKCPACPTDWFGLAETPWSSRTLKAALCPDCGHGRLPPRPNFYMWKTRRFIPIDNTSITESEVRELYQPTPKEELCQVR